MLNNVSKIKNYSFYSPSNNAVCYFFLHFGTMIFVGRIREQRLLKTISVALTHFHNFPFSQ